MTTDLYNVDNYTDAQLYDILDMSSPTDRELEAKILHLIRKYTAMQTAAGNQLSKFFDDIYKRFFKSEDSDTDDVEGFDNPNSVKEDKSSDSLQKQNITATQSFDYAQDKLQINPLIKQTITRVISIDSQYRDVTTSPFTTNFTFDLSEPLRDVVSLKLYSVQIPYTWYTVNKSYGSNFFYLKPTNSSIANDSSYNYQIKINAGTYTPTQLISAINTSFNDVSNGVASDVNFNGQPFLTYNNNTSKTTVNLNMQNTFNENYYSFSFPSTVSSNNSIAQYLGFTNQTYFPNSISSNQNAFKTDVVNTYGTAPNFIIDNSNNYFTVIQYSGLTPFTGYDGNQTVLTQQIVTLLDENNKPYIGPATRAQIIQAVKAGIAYHGFFDISSKIYQYDNPVTKNSYFILTLIWNRNTIKYIPNAKTAVIFPNETVRPNQYGSTTNQNETFSVWKYNPSATYNCFFFDNTINQFSRITSENAFVNSSYRVDLSANANINFKCNILGYNINGLNDFSLNIPAGTYSSTQFTNAITNTFQTNNSQLGNIFNMNSTAAFIDNTNRFNLSFDMLIPFTNSDYQIYIDPNKPSVLNAILNGGGGSPNYTGKFPSTITTAGNTISGNITNNAGNTGYVVDQTYILTVIPSGKKNKYAGNIDISLPASTENYSNIDDFLYGIQTAIQDTEVSIPSINSVQTPFKNSTITRSQTPNTNNEYDISLNVQCYYSLTEAIYDISFVYIGTSYANSPWYQLNLDPSYNLYKNENPQNGYATIVANGDISSNQLSVIDTSGANQFTIRTIATSRAPSDIITITIPVGLYTITNLIASFNNQLSLNSKTYGSHISQYVDGNNNGYSQLWLNINNVYTSADYMLDFWDPISFISCYSGSSSVQSTTWDTTLGWILGFRDYTQYSLTQSNHTHNTNFPEVTYYLTSTNGSYTYTPTVQGDSTNPLLLSAKITLTGDTTLSTNLFNYFLISLDDYIQNHLNDGLVTITRSQTAIQIPGYQYSTRQTCDPATNTLITTSTVQTNSDNVTNAQLYSLNQSIQSQQPSIQQYSPGPYIKDLFGIIPVKPPSNTGDTYTEFGGSLQNQTRMYFGPVNIRKMSIQLLTDRGDLVDLNGSNWTFSFVCEQLYRSSSAGT